MIYEQILNESKRLDQKLSLLQKQLQAFPPGSLSCAKNGSYHKWYHLLNREKIYLPKKKRQLAEQLAAKKYLSLLQKELLHEKEALALYLQHHSSEPSPAAQLLSPDSEYQSLLAPYFTPESEELIKWMHAPFQNNPYKPEQKVIKTVSGNMVRSKSEAMIDAALYARKIPFRYECALQLGSETIYPDFTIRHPSTGKIYYWEHFGRMDDPGYLRKTFLKQRLYATHEILPTRQLITTFETEKQPLNPAIVEETIEFYFR